ncbi:dihydropteroate synthase [Segniliparus rugosus]|uniref:dihydropteroate synthase n=1 Tax=Segniliparus rugosus (strain ATCC BAA-974 / DSM 45345 / CCUG 50838 / CIP 108380 / JCM 13579 / CDC 945) TaxID=679197 RepID=E5XQV6_SEGRC|nr:dihydropteroate synthase [Segniliparus rugosus]EFV13291.2 dihydropteroate synthase [Segniliparus rugosus ATCC BAA-974]
MSSSFTIMGVLNCTPDSFSGAGPETAEGAAREGLRLVAEGADIVDVGGESTRPGAAPVGFEEQLGRILPAVSALAGSGVFVSVDTCDARVARASLAAGARMVNDVSGGLCDPDLLVAAAEADAWLVLGHWPGAPTRDHGYRPGGTTVRHVAQELRDQTRVALSAGVRQERIVLDPGLGFGKTAAENWALLRGIGELRSVGFPVLIGASRKRFLSAGKPASDAAELAWREAGTSAVTALAATLGAWGVRVHSPLPNRAAASAAAGLAGAG